MNGSIYYTKTVCRSMLAKSQKLQSVAILIIGKSCQFEDALVHSVAVVVTLLCVNIENLVLVRRETTSVVYHHVAFERSCHNSRKVEGLFTFGFADGGTEVAQGADCDISNLENFGILLYHIMNAKS